MSHRSQRRGPAVPPVPKAIGAAIVAVVALFLALRLDRHQAPPVHLEGRVNNHGTRTVPSGATVSVLLEDTSFSPTFIRSTREAQLTLTLHDQGFHAHTFTVPSLGIDVTLAPNTSVNIPVALTDTQTVEFYCRFHSDVGMRGAFVVG